MAPFGETVLAWRLARGLTQAVLAGRAGLPRPNLSAIERGDREVTLKTLRALALALDLRPGQLADGQLPGDQTPELGRPALERVARAAVRGHAIADVHESTLARALGRAATVRRRAAGLPAPRVRGGDRALFQLRTLVAPKVVNSLIDRFGDETKRG